MCFLKYGIYNFPYIKICDQTMWRDSKLLLTDRFALWSFIYLLVY